MHAQCCRPCFARATQAVSEREESGSSGRLLQLLPGWLVEAAWRPNSEADGGFMLVLLVGAEACQHRAPQLQCLLMLC